MSKGSALLALAAGCLPWSNVSPATPRFQPDEERNAYLAAAAAKRERKLAKRRKP